MRVIVDHGVLGSTEIETDEEQIRPESLMKEMFPERLKVKLEGLERESE